MLPLSAFIASLKLWSIEALDQLNWALENYISAHFSLSSYHLTYNCAINFDSFYKKRSLKVWNIISETIEGSQKDVSTKGTKY